MKKSERFTVFSGTKEVDGELKRKSVHGALFQGMAGVFEIGFRLISTLVLARLLMPEHFGLLGMVIAVTAVAEQFSSLGLSTATIQASKVTHEQCSLLFWINLAAGCVFALVICALAPVVAAYFHDDRLIPITLAISTNFLWGGLAVQHEALLYRQMKQPQIAVIRVGAAVLSGLSAILLAYLGMGYWSLVWRELIRVILIAVGVWCMCPWVPGRLNVRTPMDGLLSFGRNMTVTQVFIAISNSLDSIIIGRFAGPVAVGLYRQAYQLMVTPVEQLNRPIYNTAQPVLSILQGEPDRYRRYYDRIVYVLGLTTIPLGLFVVVYAYDIVAVVLGSKWEGSAVFLSIFGIAAAIRPVGATSSLVMITCGKSGRYLVVIIAHFLLLAIALFIGSQWGAVGIAVAQVGTSVLIMVPKLIYSFAGTPVRIVDFLGVLSRPLIAGGVMVGMLALQHRAFPMDQGLLSLLAGLVTAAATYLGTLAILPGGYGQLTAVVKEILGVLGQRSGRLGKALPSE